MTLHAKARLATCVLLAMSVWPRAAVAEEGRSVETATFSMYCYWTGEATLGRVDGVLASRIGHWGGDEIVQVDYDPKQTDRGALVRALKQQRAFEALIATSHDEREEVLRDLGPLEIAVRSGQPHFIEPKHSLRTRHPELYALDLSERQAMVLNTWSYFGGEMPDVLTAAQKQRLEQH